MQRVSLSRGECKHGAIVLAVLTIIGVSSFSGCVTTPSEPHRSLRDALIGQSRSQILACAGKPLAETPQGDVVVLTYYMEAPMLEESSVGSKGSQSAYHHGCKARVNVQNDRVTQVQYQSVPRGYFADDHCDEIFATCAQ